MQKNIYNVLAIDDSDDEKPQTQKVTKKVQRKQDHVTRQNVGDQVEKSNKSNYQQKHSHDNQKQRGGKRTYDRQSGTGKQAFGNRKEGGFGKGNEAEGNPVNHVEEALEEVHQEAEEEKPIEPKIKSVDDYFQAKNMQFIQTKANEEQNKKTVGKKGKTNLLNEMNVERSRQQKRGQNKRKFVDLRDKDEFPSLSQLI